MGAREEILGAVPAVLARTRGDTFTAQEIIEELHRRGSRYSAATIRTHIASRMCADSPDNHARVYADLSRVARGTYRLRPENSDSGLTPEEVQQAQTWMDLALACVENGNDLLGEAALLIENDRVPRAQSLAVLAIEEYGKACQAMAIVTSGGDAAELENYEKIQLRHAGKIEAGLLLHALFDVDGASTDHYVERLKEVVWNSSARKLSGFYVDRSGAAICRPRDITREAAEEMLTVAGFIRDRLAELLARVPDHEHAALMWKYGPQLTVAIRKVIEQSRATDFQQLTAMRDLVARALNGEFDQLGTDVE